MNIDPRKLYYEDCGVYGGRTIFHYNMEFMMEEGYSVHDFLGMLVADGQRFYIENPFYPFKRLGIMLILSEGGMIFAFTNEDDYGKGTFSYIDIPEEEGGDDPGTIRGWFAAKDIQAYDILIQISKTRFRVLSCRTPMDREKYGRAYDVFRCLDLMGNCKIRKIHRNKSFHNYVRYDLGEDFYIEAYDNKYTEHREFWMGREFMFTKYLLVTFDPDDLDYRGLFYDDGNLMIDDQIAETICKLSDKHEYFFINNEYELTMKGLRMDGDKE